MIATCEEVPAGGDPSCSGSTSSALIEEEDVHDNEAKPANAGWFPLLCLLMLFLQQLLSQNPNCFKIRMYKCEHCVACRDLALAPH